MPKSIYRFRPPRDFEGGGGYPVWIDRPRDPEPMPWVPRRPSAPTRPMPLDEDEEDLRQAREAEQRQQQERERQEREEQERQAQAREAELQRQQQERERQEREARERQQREEQEQQRQTEQQRQQQERERQQREAEEQAYLQRVQELKGLISEAEQALQNIPTPPPIPPLASDDDLPPNDDNGANSDTGNCGSIYIRKVNAQEGQFFPADIFGLPDTKVNHEANIATIAGENYDLNTLREVKSNAEFEKFLQIQRKLKKYAAELHKNYERDAELSTKLNKVNGALNINNAKLALLEYKQEHSKNKLAKLANLAAFDTGDYKYSAREADFKGWLLCDGRAVSRTDYADLFAVIGEKFGRGDGSTTFNLPDARGRTPIMQGQGAGLTNREQGQQLGAENKTLSVQELPEHKHTINDPGHRHSTIPGVVAHKGGNGYYASNYAWKGGHMVDIDADRATDNWDDCACVYVTREFTGISINNTGAGQAFSLMQPSLVLGNLFIFSGKTK